VGDDGGDHTKGSKKRGNGRGSTNMGTGDRKYGGQGDENFGIEGWVTRAAPILHRGGVMQENLDTPIDSTL